MLLILSLRRHPSIYLSQVAIANFIVKHSTSAATCFPIDAFEYKYCHDNDAYCDLIDSNRPLITCENAHSTTLFN